MRHATVVRAGIVPAAVALALAAFLLPPAAASAGNHVKRSTHRPWKGYGFLPGYEPPQVVEWRKNFEARPSYWWGGPRFYRGRWNGGGFGPCWTQTPIGPHWTCG